MSKAKTVRERPKKYQKAEPIPAPPEEVARAIFRYAEKQREARLFKQDS